MIRHLRPLLFLMLTVWVLGEIAARLFFAVDPKRQGPDRTQDHPYLRTDWVPGFQTTYVLDGIADQTGTMEFKINDFGFRSSSMKTARKPEGTYRIFFLGGSTTEEIYLPEEKTFPFLVEKSLSGSAGKRLECINGGMSAYLAADTLALLIYKVLYYEPNAVIVMLGVNDLIYGTVPAYDPLRRPNYRKVIYDPHLRETFGEVLGRLLKQSHFLRLIKRRLLNRILPPEEERYKTPLEEYEALRRARKGVPFSPIQKSRSLDDFLKHLGEMIFVARGHGVRLLLMTEPSVYQEKLGPAIDEKLWMGRRETGGGQSINLSPEFLFREMNRFNDATRELASKEGVELIDLEREIPKDLVHFYDDVHLTPAGARRAGEVIAAYLSERKPFSASAPAR